MSRKSEYYKIVDGAYAILTATPEQVIDDIPTALQPAAKSIVDKASKTKDWAARKIDKAAGLSTPLHEDYVERGFSPDPDEVSDDCDGEDIFPSKIEPLPEEKTQVKKGIEDATQNLLPPPPRKKMTKADTMGDDEEYDFMGKQRTPSQERRRRKEIEEKWMQKPERENRLRKECGSKSQQLCDEENSALDDSSFFTSSLGNRCSQEKEKCTMKEPDKDDEETGFVTQPVVGGPRKTSPANTSEVMESQFLDQEKPPRKFSNPESTSSKSMHGMDEATTFSRGVASEYRGRRRAQRSSSSSRSRTTESEPRERSQASSLSLRARNQGHTRQIRRKSDSEKQEQRNRSQENMKGTDQVEDSTDDESFRPRRRGLTKPSFQKADEEEEEMLFAPFVPAKK